VESDEDSPICDFPKGRSTIEFASNSESIEAFANMKGAQIDGEEVNVSLIKITARPKPETAHLKKVKKQPESDAFSE
jgi:hypothetical protein